MKRDVTSLREREFDVCVIGGGIFGVCAAWDAAQRGLSVALIERDDFAAWTSANSYKLIHGGIRYVQHMDVRRVRESSNERRAFLRIAPHAVRPLPIVIPTYGHGMKGKEVLRIGMGIYDALTPDRSRGLADPARRVPACRTMSLTETLDFAPELPRDGLTGGALMHDGQMMNPPRLVLSFVHSAAAAGAVVANHVEAVSFERDANAITGVRFRDRLDGTEGTIRAKVTINAAGPYADLLLDAGLDAHATRRQPFSRDACFVVARPLFDDRRALAVQGATHDPEAHLSRGERHLFFAPWHGYTVVGTWHRVWDGDPNSLHVTTDELQGWLDEINAAYPAFHLTPGDVTRVNCGLVPFGENDEGAQHLKYGHRSSLIDHARVDAVDGLVTLIGVRLTMGRLEAERAVDVALRKLGRSGPRCRTAETPLHGGDTDDVEALRARLHAEAPQ
ncbi:FAD-dependent oxidoreductase, partial [bacterium]|nr:FAD-dependent oxidoreductase [bacterium]